MKKRKFSGAYDIIIPGTVSNKFDSDILKVACTKNVYIKEVLYNNPATIVFWSDGTKTVSKCHPDDTYSKESGLAICVLKKFIENKLVRQLFNDWVPVQESMFPNKITLSDVIKKNK